MLMNNIYEKTNILSQETLKFDITDIYKETMKRWTFFYLIMFI